VGEPTAAEIFELYWPPYDTAEEAMEAAFAAGRKFERAARERKRGERPSIEQLCFDALERAEEPAQYTCRQALWDAAIAWADSAESEELAKLRAEPTLRARHAALCEQINEEATPFREAPLPVACAERDRLWERIQELESGEADE
jgi:hypothetical protein